jgi:hypothetical protein
MAANSTFSVKVKEAGSAVWQDLFVHEVKVGHQKQVQPVPSSMVAFDFLGQVELQITHNAGPINSHDIRPSSYGIQASVVGSSLSFSMTQKPDAPRKIVVRVNDDWEQSVLHIVTNPPETSPPAPTDPGVHVVQPGAPVPLSLPAGKNTYYFAPGVHRLPRGSWIDVDLGSVTTIDRINIVPGKFYGNEPIDPQRFEIEGFTQSGGTRTFHYDGKNNAQTGPIKLTFPASKVRHLRLWLLGNNGPSRYRRANSITELEVYPQGSGTNVALGRATAGAMPSFAAATDGDHATPFSSKLGFGNKGSGETFYLTRDNLAVYLAPGAVVRGAIGADSLSNLSISGRGILDGAELDQNRDLEKTSTVSLVGGSDNAVEGITVVNPPMWAVVLDAATRPIVRRVSIFGSTINGDGIHFDGSSGGTIDGVFIRTCDDNITMYHYGESAHNQITNSVLMTDDGSSFVLGLGHIPGSPVHSNAIRNIDVITQQGVWDLSRFTGVIRLWATGGNEIRDLVFQDIRIDAFRFPDRGSVFHFRTDAPTAAESPGRRIKNITLQNISYNGSGELSSVLYGLDSSHNIEDIFIDGYTRNNTGVTGVADGNIKVMGSVSNVRFGQSASSSSPAQAPTTFTPAPAGLFRVGAGGYVGNVAAYCSLDSGAHMLACGYTQAQYDVAPQYPLDLSGLKYDGSCACPLPKYYGLFRSGAAGFVSQKNGYCLLESAQHLLQCAFSQQQYDVAPQKDPGTGTMGPYLGSCKCQ